MTTPSGGSNNISTVDYVILGISVSIPFFIAIWTAFKNKNTTEDFFTAKSSMGPLTVALSFLSTCISSYMILAYSAEIYGYGLEFVIAIVGGLIGIPLFTYMNLKVFYDLKVATIYQYLEMRYNSPQLRVALVILDTLRTMIPMGVALCGTCLILEVVTSVDVKTYIFIFGFICAFYATIGGMRGVIWTDAFMMIIMILGLLAVIVVGCLQLGPLQIWEIASRGGRTKVFNFDPNLFQRQNFYLLIIHGMLMYGKMYASGQSALQRAFAVKSFKEYKKAVSIILVLFIIVHVLMFWAGLTAYSIYVGCDPLAEGKIQKIDQILPYLISDKMNTIPGISGIFLAGMVCAGISSVTSKMTVFSNLVYSDLLCKVDSFKKLSDRKAVIVCRAITFLTAVPSISIALAVTKAGSILPIVIILSGLFGGPTFGVFFLALLFPMTKLIGAIVGFFVSLAILGWMAVGRVLYTSGDELLPLSDEFCSSPVLNATTISESLSLYSVNQTILDTPANETSSVTTMYNVSYLFFNVFGPIICIFVGLCVTYIKGPEKVENVPEELISPIVRRFYYKNKTERKIAQENE